MQWLRNISFNVFIQIRSDEDCNAELPFCVSNVCSECKENTDCITTDGINVCCKGWCVECCFDFDCRHYENGYVPCLDEVCGCHHDVDCSFVCPICVKIWNNVRI